MPKNEHNFNRMKKGGVKLFIKSAPAPKPVKLQKKTLERRSTAIWSFLEKRPLLALKRVAEASGWQVGNFQKYQKGKKKIPEKYLFKLEDLLESYGLTVFR